MDPKPAILQQIDADALPLVHNILTSARTGALGVVGPDGAPYVTRIAILLGPGAEGQILVSDLSIHTACMRADPRVSLLVDGPRGKGNPLNSPRVSLSARADFVARDDPSRPARRTAWLKRHPKSRLYVDFADFHFIRLSLLGGHFNGGFARAFFLPPQDLMLP
jgi:putative heme iron utilization protein